MKRLMASPHLAPGLRRDMVVTILLATVAAVAAYVLPVGLPRLLLAAPLVLALPGHALRRALRLLEDGGEPPLRRATTWTFDLGLSLSAVVLVGLGLDRFPAGLSLDSWMVGLLFVTLSAVAFAIFRDHRVASMTPCFQDVSVTDQPAVELTSSGANRFRFQGFRGATVGLPLVVCWVLAAAVTTSAVTYSILDARHVAASTTFTQFSLTRGTGKVYLDVRSFERSDTTYTVAVLRGGELQGGRPAFVLRPGEERRLSFYYYTTAKPEEISFVLHRAPDPGTYREVHYWTDTPVPSP